MLLPIGLPLYVTSAGSAISGGSGQTWDIFSTSLRSEVLKTRRLIDGSQSYRDPLCSTSDLATTLTSAAHAAHSPVGQSVRLLLRLHPFLRHHWEWYQFDIDPEAFPFDFYIFVRVDRDHWLRGCCIIREHQAYSRCGIRAGEPLPSAGWAEREVVIPTLRQLRSIQ